jgi:mycothiol synthase
MQFTIRNYCAEDLESIVALINAADAFDKIEDGTSVKEMRIELTAPDVNPEENVFVAEEANGRIVGYAFLRLMKDSHQSSFRTWFIVHPDCRGHGLEDQLLAWQYARAEERLGECESATIDFFSHANVRERERIAVLERFGLREARRFWLMVRPSLRDLPAPQLPNRIVTRAYRVNDDHVRMHAATNDTFRDHWGHTEHPLEMWLHYVAQPMFKPNLTVIAENTATRQIAGFCVVAINDEENRRLGIQRGWIDILGVRRPYRQRGLGTALLLEGLWNLRDAGLAQAALTCDSENLTGATRIYERVGFVVEKTRVTYRKHMCGVVARDE